MSHVALRTLQLGSLLLGTCILGFYLPIPEAIGIFFIGWALMPRLEL